MKMEGCVALVLSRLSTENRQALSRDPANGVKDIFGLTVRRAEHLGEGRGVDGACDGMSFLDDGVLLYSPTPNSRRQNFTILHELAHWLIDREKDIVVWAADQEGSDQLLETMCDHIAQQLLLSDESVSTVVGQGPVRALHFLQLLEDFEASRQVCAIALTKKLGGAGAVVVIDKIDKRVEFASVRPHPRHGWPKVYPWRAQQIADWHPLVQLPSQANRTDRMEWSTPWGERGYYYVDALADDRRVYAVFSETDLWEALRFHSKHPFEYDQRLALQGYCCGQPFTRRGYPCPDCNRPYCPRCDQCKCQRDQEREELCSECFLQRPAHRMVNGVCTDCR